MYVKPLAEAGDHETERERGRDVYLKIEQSPQVIRRALGELETSREVELLSPCERVGQERTKRESQAGSQVSEPSVDKHIV